jgi:hypothetical protein
MCSEKREREGRKTENKNRRKPEVFTHILQKMSKQKDC